MGEQGVDLRFRAQRREHDEEAEFQGGKISEPLGKSSAPP